MADQRWRHRPALMSPVTIDHVATRIAEHVSAHGLTDVDVTFHGGEPLLAGPDRIAYAVRRIRTAVAGASTDPETSTETSTAAGTETSTAAGTAAGGTTDTASGDITSTTPDGPAGPRVRFNIHTNGVRLTPGYLRLFDELGIHVSVSLDGAAAAHDRHRRQADGRGSHAAVSAALRLLTAEPYHQLFGGLLCAVDLRNPPVETYEALLEFAPPAVDFLLPHGTWSDPPAGRSPSSPATPYADWLVAVFERWIEAPVQETRIRLFEEIINVLLGGHSRTEGVGLSPVAVVVVETDGAIEQSDMLAAAFDGAARTGLRVERDSFDAALRLPGIAARQIGMDALCATCRACAVRRTCGGGLYPHRYRAGAGFANPSVYCRDLYRLITHVRSRLDGYVAALRDRPTA